MVLTFCFLGLWCVSFSGTLIFFEGKSEVNMDL